MTLISLWLILPLLLIHALSAGLPCFAAESASQERADSLRQLQELRSNNVKRLSEIDRAIREKIDHSDRKKLEEDVKQLKVEQHEHVLRQDLLDRLILQVDTKFRGGDLRRFLCETLVEMAKVDAVSTAQSGLYKFMSFSAEAIRRLPEQKENVLAFLEGYMDRSISNPVAPEVYLAERNYSNGYQNSAGHPMDREAVGELAEKRLRQLKQQEPLSKTH